MADIISANHQEAQADRAATRERLEHIAAQAEADRTAGRERLDRFEAQAEADRALVLRLIESIAQGRNGQ